MLVKPRWFQLIGRQALWIGAIGLAFLVAACSPERQVGYQAILTDANGVPVEDGAYNVTVKLYNSATDATSGALKYTDTQSVTVANGLMNIAIPDTTGESDLIDSAIYAQPLWMELTINGETLSPRQKLLGAPYAMTLPGGAFISNPSDKPASPTPSADRAALTIGNFYASGEAGSPGATGLTVGILDSSSASIIRGCLGDLNGNCSNLRFEVDESGNVAADGSYTSPAADYAEYVAVESGQPLPQPGEVLAISTVEDNTVTLASSANSTLVAGVVSTQPGFIGGVQTEHSVLAALVGVVPVKVSAENGPIARGDLLVSSATPGLAMRAESPALGTVIGKALGQLSSGEGVIQVLLTLQ